jgi:uncharacterized glyoxalase superfamily protein PhnB
MGDLGPMPPPVPHGEAVQASEVTANVSFVYITVDDMARSLTFYSHLGFTFPPEAYAEGHVEAELKNGLLIFWNHVSLVRRYVPDYEPSSHGRIGLAFQLESAAAVDRVASDLKRRGYEVRTPYDTPWGHRQVVAYDPEGNSVNIFAPYT